ncbi:MAG: AMP-binding protein [Verrucomicrobiota bacterium]
MRRRLVIMPPNTPSLKELSEAIQRHQITTLWLTAGLFQLMVDEELTGLKSLRQLLAGGDVLSFPHVRKALGELTGCRIINGYGPTENTTFTCCHSISEQDLSRTSIPIGRPISGTRVYILDRFLQPVGIGVAGELYISGDGLARGYLNRPALTADSFVPNPFSDQPGDRLYRSGDLARYLTGGAIEFLGRLDEQVKIRGYRIELGEIEAALALHPAVREAIGLVRNEVNGEKRLLAYVVPKAADSSAKNGALHSASLEGELRKFLQDKLPDYMVPAAFVILNNLPLTPNGKVNRAALPTPAATLPAVPKAYVAPRDSLEMQLVKLWEKIFGIRPIGVQDNFFELGGHSLLAVRMFAQVARVTGKNLPLVTLFEAPTIEQLAKLLGQDGWTQPWSPLVPIKLTGSRPPFYCVHGVGGNIVEFTHLARYLEAEQPLYGIQAQGLDGKKPWLTRVEDMAALYIKEIRAFQPDGPYYLGGSSFGGLVAYEMAQQLHAQGEHAALLVLFDTNAPSYPKYLPTTTAFRKALNELRLRIEVHWSNLKVIEPENRGEYLRDKAYRLRRRIRNTMRQKYRRLCTIIQSLYLPRPIREVQRSGHEANRSYLPKPYPGWITLFRATEQPYGIYPDPALGWGELAIGGLEIVDVMGHHGAIIREPRVRVLAQKLNESLRKAQVTNRIEPKELSAATGLSSLPTT